MADSVIQLKCSCNNYPWGKKGEQSLAARYCAATPGTDFQIDNGTEYSEMWMGTYPELPASVLSSGEDLQQVLNAHKERLIGEAVLKKFGTNLPFLPKILSIQKALPLQIHPDKEMAAELHEKDPEKYTDDNHKPEIAVALSKFESFVGFKALGDIDELFKELDFLQRFLPENYSNKEPGLLQKLLPGNRSKFDNETLKTVCRNILGASDEVIADTQKQLGNVPMKSLGKQTYILELLPRLQQQYSKTDPGNLVALLLMNYLVLSPNDAIYIPADGIHAYLSGDIVECMARSNNVINTGFCPPASRDSVDLFTSALTFTPHSANEAILPSAASKRGRHGRTKEYAPPMSEFNMLVTELEAGQQEMVAVIHGPSIMIVTSGSGTMKAVGKTHELREGYVFFIGCGVAVQFESEKGLVVYRAYAEA